ncbi:kinase-like protein [Pseudovirgaria hyperparasitica]|uniref:Kinase-like protein n=1 Tax=Pseudovirgaria hyperparasitica TaxID=470096 RepID=A0A6A6W9M6_9PEZI|nr:kinase-like protein [Pseudovirgaria hyperparasitica]KAF2758576.1 kinase-like protein [Pseudovirgaria hyperparasitica]
MVESDSESSDVDIAEKLRELIGEAEQSSDNEGWGYYVPISEQRSIITAERVFLHVRSLKKRGTTDLVTRYTEQICTTAISLFATLLRGKKDSEICNLLDDGLSDRDLPLVRTPVSNRIGEKKFCLARNDEAKTTVEAMRRWAQSDLKDFGQYQFRMLAPVFDRYKPKGQLSNDTILPYVWDDQDHRPVENDRGGYSEVVKRRLHPSHHNFWEEESQEPRRRYVAVKRLNSGDLQEFEKEVSILRKLGVRKNAHLVQLLDTFTFRGQPHLMFHWADANLRQYWETKEHPKFDQSTVLWSLQQMKGIAQALSLIHNYTTHPTLPLSDRLDHQNERLGVIDHEKHFGRHGDIKPENFLWFSDLDGGVLQIADFGMGRFHGRDSRSKVRPTTAQATPTYEPPECALRIAVSRKYDTWSLGCVFMEYITWLILGNQATEDFAEARSKMNSLKIDDDKFYEIVHRNGDTKAIVTIGVEKWASKLRKNKRCSQAIHDLIDIIMESMLVIDQTKRLTSRQLFLELKEIVARSTEDQGYLLDAPRLNLPNRQILGASDGPEYRLNGTRQTNTWPINGS